ncbi:MAG: AAA family ATPase, partial [Acidobacteria bacterium]|nr:AAA family ATPase [Acidobacteriota bacterium]
PPGYVGYEEGGQLTEHVRRRPYSVVLFDEIEKAHPDVFNALLQILDDGRLTDGKGRTVNFNNSMIILTTNVGSSYLDQLKGIGFSPLAERQDKVRDIQHRLDEALRQTFKPEFLNRVDDIIHFNPLSEEDISKIVEMQVATLKKLLAEKKVRIELQPAAQQLLFKRGYDPNFGARPLRRAIQTLIQDPLAMKILDGEVVPGDTVLVNADLEKGVMTFEKAPVATAAQQPQHNKGRLRSGVIRAATVRERTKNSD